MVPCLNIASPFLGGRTVGYTDCPDPTPREAPGMFITVPIKPARFMALLFNSFNSLFIGRLIFVDLFSLETNKNNMC